MMNQAVATNWTAPYFGVQHIGKCSARGWWGTVADYGSFSKALCWFPGCGFSPIESEHDDAESARAHVETWLRAQHQ